MRYILLLFVLVQGCSVSVGSGSDHAKDFWTDHPIVAFKDVKDLAKPYQYVETNAADVLSYVKQFDHSIVYQLAAWCPPCVKKFTTDYPFLDSVSKAPVPIKVFVVSNSYGSARLIEKLYKKVGYVSPIYVMPNKEYGGKVEQKSELFVRQLCDTCTSSPNGGNFYFEKNKLVRYVLPDEGIAGLLPK